MIGHFDKSVHLPRLRQLAYLVALDEHRHFGRAAESCHVTQSTLSAGLQDLESLLGAVLVERTRRRVMMTPLGEEVAHRARRLLRDAGDIVELAQARAAPLTGPLRLGAIPTVGPFLLPRALPALRRAHPGLKLYLREALTARLLEALGAGDLDAALIALPYPLDNLAQAEIGRDDFVLVCPPDHPLATGGAVPLDAVARQDLLLLEEGHCLREHALSACRLDPRRHNAAFSGTSLPTLVQMVANGIGVTLLPRLALAAGLLRGTGLVARPLAGGAPPRRLALVWRHSAPRADDFEALAAFLRRMSESAEEGGDRGDGAGQRAGDNTAREA